MKTARFKDVVKKAGTPSPYLAFMEPGKDPALKREFRENRVLTIHRSPRGGAKEFGTVGLAWKKGDQILVFPRSLKRFAAARVVAIDFGLVEGEARTGTELAPPAKPKASARAAKVPARFARRPSPPPVESEPEPPPEPLALPATMAEVRRAARELKAGKAAAAYDRLQALIQANEAV